MAAIQQIIEKTQSTASCSSKNVDAHEQSNAQMVQIDLVIWLDNSIDESSEDWQHTISQLGGVVDAING
jgi:hypothetical protein